MSERPSASTKKPPSQAAMSGSRWVNRAFNSVPVVTRTAGSAQSPMAGEVLGELVRRCDADPGESDQRGGDAQIGRVEQMTAPSGDLHANEALRGDRDNGREHHSTEAVVGVQQHAGRQAGDMRREEKVDEVSHSSRETECPPSQERIDDLEHELGGVGRKQGDKRHDWSLLEPQHRVSEYIQDRYGGGKTPETAKPPISLPLD